MRDTRLALRRASLGHAPRDFITLSQADRFTLPRSVIAWATEACFESRDRTPVGDGLGTVEVMRRTHKSRTCVGRWQERFATEGLAGLLIATFVVELENRGHLTSSDVVPLGKFAR